MDTAINSMKLFGKRKKRQVQNAVFPLITDISSRKRLYIINNRR